MQRELLYKRRLDMDRAVNKAQSTSGGVDLSKATSDMPDKSVVRNCFGG